MNAYPDRVRAFFIYGKMSKKHHTIVFTYTTFYDIEDAYLRRKQRVPVIEDIDGDYVTDEPVFTGESQDETVTVKINAAVISQYEGYDVLWQHDDSSSDPSAGSLYLGKRENYDNRGN